MAKEIHIPSIVKVDSFSLLIPINLVKIVDSKYLEKYVRVYESGEVEDNETFFNNTHFRKINGVKYKISKVKRIWNGKNEDFIQIIANSKMLKKDYFNGINSKNIHSIVKDINELDIVYIDLNTALNSYVTDVDLCKDFRINLNEFSNLTKIVNQNIIYSKKKHARSFRNSNLQLNERPKATPSAPFVKYYFKTLELADHSTDFKNAYFSDENIDNIARIETTIKASKHKKALNIEYTTLKDLLELSQDKLLTTYKTMLKSYMEKKINGINKSDITPADQVELNSIEREINNGTTIEEMIHFKLKGLEGMSKARQKKRLLNLIAIAENKDLISINQAQHKNVIEVLKNIGIFE